MIRSGKPLTNFSGEAVRKLGPETYVRPRRKSTPYPYA